MFRRGKVLKVKVELSPEVVGFGRATILESEGGRLMLQLKTAKGEHRNLPKGTRVWFVSDSTESPFNGLWSTTVISTRVVSGKTALECARPKFEAAVQRRKQKRVAVTCPVRLQGEKYEKLAANTRNLSRSGIGLDLPEDCTDLFPTGHHVDFVIDTPFGPAPVTSSVVQSRYNWLANRTDVGLEFVKVSEEANATLERLLLSLGGQARFAPEGKEKGTTGSPGQLSGWLKSTKDSISFVKVAESKATTVLSDDDLEELATDDDSADDEE